ncbi:CDC23 (cell division cycle 23, yeast, homolog), isoform CRA_d [Mus musculus]|nr:CDC23 (cell division cycle 23, yeast, homolog), isoform CRA_d [Mus musculus]
MVCGVGLLSARLAFVGAAAAAASDRGKGTVTVAIPLTEGCAPGYSAPCHWRGASCSVGVMSQRRRLLSGASQGGSCVGVVCALKGRCSLRCYRSWGELVSNYCLRSQPRRS